LSVGLGIGGTGIDIHYSSGSLYVYFCGTARTFAWTPVAGRWTNIVLQRRAGTLEAFIHGQKSASTYADASSVAVSNGVRIGVAGDVGYGGWNGAIREVRISDVARYTDSFTPSQTGFTVDANTKLYIKGNEDNGVTTFVDQTGKTVTTAGDTKIKYTEDYRSCIFKDDSASAHHPYPVGSAKVDFMAIGSGVGYFDGTNSTITTPSAADLNLASEDFTIELYARHSNVSDGTQGYVRKLANAGGTGFCFLRNTGNGLAFFINGNAVPIQAPSAGGFTLNTWEHLSVTRSGTTYRLFVNGNLEATATSATAIADNTEVLMVGKGSTYSAGSWYKEADYFLIGLLDNIRISKGVARYTATFNPPSDFPVNSGFLPFFMGI